MFQEPRLLPWLDVAANVGFELGRAGRRDPRVQHLLREVGLDEFAAAWPRQLSGGMAQRAAIARGLLAEPALLLLDEPFSAVDALTRMRLQELLLTLARRRGTALLLVTHDVAEAVQLSDRILVLSGRPATLLREIRVPLDHPRDRRDLAAARLAGEVPALLGDPADARPARIAPPAG